MESLDPLLRPPLDKAQRRSSAFGLYSDSDCDSEDESEPETPPPPPPKPMSIKRSPSEQRYIEDTVAAIRLRTRYRDPYEEWEKHTRKDAFRTARKQQSALRSTLHYARIPVQAQYHAHLTAHHAHQRAEVEGLLANLKLRQTNEDNRLKEACSDRGRRLRERIESGIQYEEEKVRAKLEAERKARQEEEKRRQEAEKRRQEEEKAKRQAEEEAARRAREENVRAKEDAKRQAQEEESRRRLASSEGEAKERMRLGFTSVNEDWWFARETLLRLKSEVIAPIKGDKQLRSTWNALRRQITPKIGQLTTDPEVITRVSKQLLAILLPTPPHTPQIYRSLLSSLSKCILLQAETEVTAEKRSAQPLAQVAVSLLESLDGFAEVLYSKLGQRAGAWVVPCAVPELDVGGRKWEAGEREKAMGYRQNGKGETENVGEYVTRVAGLMRVYFAILRTPVVKPLHRMFQLPRYWIWFARIMAQVGLLETAIAPQLIYAALDVFGLDAKVYWGHQWNKLLALLYEGVTVGIGGEDGKLIGGKTAEGNAARTRVQLEVERIMRQDVRFA